MEPFTLRCPINLILMESLTWQYGPHELALDFTIQDTFFPPADPGPFLEYSLYDELVDYYYNMYSALDRWAAAGSG